MSEKEETGQKKSWGWCIVTGPSIGVFCEGMGSFIPSNMYGTSSLLGTGDATAPSIEDVGISW